MHRVPDKTRMNRCKIIEKMPELVLIFMEDDNGWVNTGGGWRPVCLVEGNEVNQVSWGQAKLRARWQRKRASVGCAREVDKVE